MVPKMVLDRKKGLNAIFEQTQCSQSLSTDRFVSGSMWSNALLESFNFDGVFRQLVLKKKANYFERETALILKLDEENRDSMRPLQGATAMYRVECWIQGVVVSNDCCTNAALAAWQIRTSSTRVN